jgi:hypothetical protein
VTQFHDPQSGTYKLVPTADGLLLQWQSLAGIPAYEIVPLSPDAGRLLAWHLLRHFDPGALVDAFNPPRRMAVEAVVVAFPTRVHVAGAMQV